jgi:hypothetical protein
VTNDLSTSIYAIGAIGVIAALLLFHLQLKPAAARLHPGNDAGCFSQLWAMFLLTIVAIPAFLALALTAFTVIALYVRAVIQQGGI